MTNSAINEFKARYTFLATYLAITFAGFVCVHYDLSAFVGIIVGFVSWIVMMIVRHKITMFCVGN